MLYLDANSLVPFMNLARDIHYYDTSLNKMIEIKKGTLLTQTLIAHLKATKINGAYINYIPDDIETAHTVNIEIKTQAISEIKQLAENFQGSPDGVQAAQIAALCKTSASLVDGISRDKNVLVNIFDLKMYDDYTYHHSLSVAVIALAIGMELGFNNKTLQELVLSGMLHDIGKVTIPVDIITKPSRLTKEEFAIVKLHPVNAGTYLLKKNLVTENIFNGIISHHEKWDGTGYPNGTEGSKIPLFARILTVADVYDALTSNRPYRTPSQPTEAIEYIMGGAGTFFDLDIVKAFLRRIAPYPVGTKVSLSNGEIATVIKNNPQQPLRPIVKVNGNQEIYDLYNNFNTMNIIITGIVAKKPE